MWAERGHRSRRKEAATSRARTRTHPALAPRPVRVALRRCAGEQERQEAERCCEAGSHVEEAAVLREACTRAVRTQLLARDVCQGTPSSSALCCAPFCFVCARSTWGSTFKYGQHAAQNPPRFKFNLEGAFKLKPGGAGASAAPEQTRRPLGLSLATARIWTRCGGRGSARPPRARAARAPT